jgi:putative PIN family toxin of toxin-antitoxin system
LIVVIDSIVWISALGYGGTPAAAIRKALTSSRIALCAEIVSEVRRGLIEKAKWSPAEVDARFPGLAGQAVMVPISGRVHGSRDPNDDMILECAVNATADLIVTGDGYLLDLVSFRNIRILTPRQYLDLPR